MTDGFSNAFAATDYACWRCGHGSDGCSCVACPECWKEKAHCICGLDLAPYSSWEETVGAWGNPEMVHACGYADITGDDWQLGHCPRCFPVHGPWRSHAYGQ